MNQKLPQIKRDYELFKQNQSICFVEQETYCRQYVNNKKPNGLRNFEFNKKFTENPDIDIQLNEILELIFKHHVYPWHRLISNDETVPFNLYCYLHYTISAFVFRFCSKYNFCKSF